MCMLYAVDMSLSLECHCRHGSVHLVYSKIQASVNRPVVALSQEDSKSFVSDLWID